MDKIKKYSSPFIFFIILFLANIFIIETKGLSNLDFFWVYGDSYDIRAGLLPYVDFNMIRFPLFSSLMALFAETTVTYYIFGALIYALLSTALFVCLKDARWILFVICIIKLLALEFWEYNSLMIFFLIFSFISIRKYYETYKSRYLFFTGILLCLGLLTKHDVPAIVIICSTIFIFVRCIKEKKFKDFLLYAIGGLLPAIILLCFAFKLEFIEEMVDMTILGVAGFKSLQDFHLSSYAIYLLIFFMMLIVIYYCFEKSFKDYFYAFGYILAGIQIIKIGDLFHVVCGLLYFGSIFLILLQDNDMSLSKLIESVKNKKITLSGVLHVVFSLSLMCSMLLVGICAGLNYDYMKNDNTHQVSNSRIYQDIKINTLFNNVLDATTKYIDAHPDDNICVASELARIVSLYYDTHWGFLDLNLIHNGGVNGTEHIIDKMKEFDKVISLETDSMAVDKDIYTYIKKNFEVCDTITINDKEYFVYSTK